MLKKPVETIMGLVVLLIALLFLGFAYNVSDLQVVKGYTLTAEFMKVGGLSTGSDVRINGIKVGTVTNQTLNNEDYTVDVTFSISSDIKLPKDSTVAIVSDGLMGNKFVKIEPGKSSEYLKDGEAFTKTKDFKTLEDMVGEIIFMVTDGGQKNEK
ncbi:MAG: outer membrane lipid asymmetry maintenance protein MlaD [Alphaproteobacteria bacterium]|nr:outer membrane lipid asymmetry maintenance protein MlaD [Alphaproteobacteria bacterium]